MTKKVLITFLSTPFQEYQKVSSSSFHFGHQITYSVSYNPLYRFIKLRLETV